MQKYFTTPIYYINGSPHIGHAYTTILGDVLKKFEQMRGADVFYTTGTDEHGQKNQTSCQESGLPLPEFLKMRSDNFRNLFDKMDIDYDHFVRTSSDEHKAVVTEALNYIYNKGLIRKKSYEGLYCEGCEQFKKPSDLDERGFCPDHQKAPKLITEENYFFPLEQDRQWLIDYINTHPEFIQPVSRKNEMMNNFLLPGLQDLCVSRTSFKWGIPVDFDDKHIIYVWIDALSNYITFLGYNPDGESSEPFKKYWPANVHLIGKDILRFHTIYWPIMLHCLGLEMPKHIFGHPWLLFASDKMSKSKGNIVYADDLVEKYGVDAVRYYLLHEIPFASDGNFTIELLENSINSDLANVLGNLVNRTIGMINKYFDGEVENTNITEDIDDDLKSTISNSIAIINSKMDEFKIADALDELFNIFRRCNKYIDETTPWILAKEPEKQARLKTVLYNLIESIRIGAVLLQAFLPETAESIFKQINTDKTTIDTIINALTIPTSFVRVSWFTL